MPIAPIVHLNGTSKESLMKQLREACDALHTAIGALIEACPHQRDYYPLHSETYRQAREDHRERIRVVENMRKDLVKIAIAIDEGRCGIV